MIWISADFIFNYVHVCIYVCVNMCIWVSVSEEARRGPRSGGCMSPVYVPGYEVRSWAIVVCALSHWALYCLPLTYQSTYVWCLGLSVNWTQSEQPGEHPQEGPSRVAGPPRACLLVILMALIGRKTKLVLKRRKQAEQWQAGVSWLWTWLAASSPCGFNFLSVMRSNLELQDK